MEFSLLATASRPTLGSTQPPMGKVVEVLLPKVKRPRHDTDYPTPSSAEV